MSRRRSSGERLEDTFVSPVRELYFYRYLKEDNPTYFRNGKSRFPNINVSLSTSIFLFTLLNHRRNSNLTTVKVNFIGYQVQHIY